MLQLADISDDGYLCLMADNGELREDLKIPDGELGTQLRADHEAGKELLVSIVLLQKRLIKINYKIFYLNINKVYAYSLLYHLYFAICTNFCTSFLFA